MKTYRSAPSPRTEEKLHQLRDLLPAGRETPMSTFLLCGILECRARQLQEWVAELRERGVLVGSTDRAPFGYFLMRPDDEEDWKAGTAHIYARAYATLKAVRGLEKVRERAGKPRLFDLEAAV